ncbi:MAG: polysaccharide biosynthesis tyrosine autokinase [Janthinobacterium lividum]
MSQPPFIAQRDDQHRSYLSAETSALDTDDGPSLVEYRDMVLDRKWFIAAVMAVAFAASLLYVTLAAPIYRANLLLQIEDSAPASKSYLTDTTGLGELKTTASGEIQVLGSRMVLGAAVDQAGLQVEAQPRYAPFYGEWLARGATNLSTPGILGMGGYVTGTERIVVQRFDVPASFEDTGRFTITVLDDGHYVVRHPLLETAIDGVVGKPLEMKVPDGTFDIQISTLAGRRGAEFIVNVFSRLKAIERLQQRLLLAEQGRLSNVVSVSLEDSNRARLALTLNAIGDQYVRQNVERKSAEAEKTLAFLSEQLPVFERQLKTSEDAFARFRNEHGTIAFDEEAKVWLRSSADLQTNLLQLQQSRLDLMRISNDSHPKVQTLNQQIAAVQGQLANLNKKITAMPNVQRDALRLERDMRANDAQYQSMQNNALQMRLLKEGKVGNVRLLDGAMVSKEPVKPQKSLIVAFALILGALAGPAYAIFSGRARNGQHSPNELSARTGLELYGVIPQSREQMKIEAIGQKGKAGALLAEQYPHSRSVEALRGLRVSLKNTLNNARNNCILVTGATPNIGKSFVASNFAFLLAQTGKKVLLVNADFRKGNETGDFEVDRSIGLSEFLNGEIVLEQAIQVNLKSNLDLLPTGRLPDHPADLLESKSFADLLERLSAQYDHVLIDTAPILVAADAATVAPYCGCVLLVARAGLTGVKELTEGVRRLAQAGATVDGLLMNGADNSRQYYGYYSYENGSVNHRKKASA